MWGGGFYVDEFLGYGVSKLYAASMEADAAVGVGAIKTVF